MYRLGNIIASSYSKTHMPYSMSTKEATVGEPGVTHPGSRNIIFFNSMEEENDHTHRQYATMTPEKRLAAVTQMRLTTYPHLNTNLNPWGNTVYFDDL